jgi:hypothetical protein
VLACSTCMASPSTLSSAEIWTCPVKSPPVAAYYRALHVLALRPARGNEKDASHPFLQPTYDTSTHEKVRRFPGCAHARPCGLACVAVRLEGQTTPGSASLDGEASSFGFHHHLQTISGNRSFLAIVEGAPLGPGGCCDSTAPPAALSSRALSSLDRVGDLASDVLCRTRRRCLRRSVDRVAERQTRFGHGLVKGHDLPGSGRLPSMRALSTSLARSFAESLSSSTRLSRRMPTSYTLSPADISEARPTRVSVKARCSATTSATCMNPWARPRFV